MNFKDAPFPFVGELWDLYDKQRNKTNLTLRRGQPILNGLYHLVVSIWVCNSKGQYLMSQRHPEKNYPEYWECTGGSVLAGETSLQGAIREVKEELGVDLYKYSGKIVKSILREDSQDFYDVWMFDIGEDCPELILQKEEVINAKWMNVSEIDKLYEQGMLHPLLMYYKDVL
ncbi:NUDIX domain-containing protein [Sedimentibacter sp. zth1]|nr:NUDIX domain-containing protein [Sedimentibacter sp. zth1]